MAGESGRLNQTAAAGQDELFPSWHQHAVFATNSIQMLQAERLHRDP